MAAANTAAANFAIALASRIQRDIVPSQIEPRNGVSETAQSQIDRGSRAVWLTRL
jgi:hypothetical protein